MLHKVAGQGLLQARQRFCFIHSLWYYVGSQQLETTETCISNNWGWKYSCILNTDS